MTPAPAPLAPLSSRDWRAELLVARLAAERAGTHIASRWGQPFSVEHKGEVDLVSEVDLAAERIIAEVLRAQFPEDTIVAEEGGDHTGDSGRTWLVDPLDGTTNFSHGFPHFCVSIALLTRGMPVVGVVHDPIRRWTFLASQGGGAWRDGMPLHVSGTGSLGDALLATGFPYDRRSNPDNNSHRAAYLLRRAQGLRRAGSAALDLAFVAAGWLDGYWEDRLKPWDLAAGYVLVTEAGGALTDFDGGRPDLNVGRLVATNGAIHAQLVEALVAAESSPGAPNSPRPSE